MDRHTSAIYKRGAVVVLPILAIVGCRVGLRACVAVDRSSRHGSLGDPLAQQREDERRAAELAAAATTADPPPRARPRALPPGAPGGPTTTVASGQDVPDALAMDAQNIAWLDTRSGDVVVLARSEGATPRVVAKEQKLPQRRHVQGLALAGGYVYWMTSTLPRAATEDGSILRAALGVDGGAPGEPEVVAEGLGGISALLVDKENVYYARSRRISRDEDGGATGGVYRIRLGPKSKPAKDAQLLFAAERPCALAADETAVYAADAMKIWRAPKAKGDAKAIVEDTAGFACTVAVDSDHVFWTVPTEDTVMRARKGDGSEVSSLAFVHKRPTNIAADKGYVYVLTETSPNAFGELGNVFRVPIRGAGSPTPIVTDQVGLGSLAVSGGVVVFSGYNEAESDGTVVLVVPESSGFKKSVTKDGR